MLSYKTGKSKKFKGLVPIVLILTFLIGASLNNKAYSAVSLNLYQTLGEEKGFIAPNGVTADASNNVYIADYSAGKVYKLTPPPTINVTTFKTIAQPVAVAYYSNRIYVFSMSEGGKAYNVSDGSYANISFGTGYGDYRDVKKPADMVIDSSGNIYVADMDDNYVKKYNPSGTFVETIGGKFPINDSSSSFGNGLFYIMSTLAYDSVTNRLLVGDSGNPSPYIQTGSKATPIKSGGKITGWTWTKSSKLYGRPKGKVQIYNLASSTWIRQVLGHGNRSNYGQVYGVAGLWVDTTNNHLYVIDSENRKILVIDNVANDSKAPLWTTRSAQDQQELKINEAAVADSPNQEPIDSPSRYTIVQGIYDLSANFGLLKDIIKVGNYLIVTDRFGKVYYFTVSIF